MRSCIVKTATRYLYIIKKISFMSHASANCVRMYVCNAVLILCLNTFNVHRLHFCCDSIA